MIVKTQGMFCAMVFAGIMGGAALCQTAFAAINLNDGEWEMTTTFQGGKPQTSTECITKADLNSKDDEPGCKVEKKVSGNTVKIHSVCDRGNGAKEDAQAEETFSGDTMKGTMRIQAAGPDGKPMTLTGTISGRRIGACKAKGK
jgi:hypothetical protein